MPVVRHVTEEEIQAAADAEGYTVVFQPCLRESRVAFTVKTYTNVTTTKKGERVEEVIDLKPNDNVEFREMICAAFGDRDGFVYTNGQTMFKGDGTALEYVPPPVVRAPLSEEHKAALMEGRKRAREAAKQMPATPEPKVVTIESEDNALYNAGCYRNPCRECGKGISRTNRKGRAPTTHKAAKEQCP